ncbi:unnamed protein product [Fusarium equiseti]|uniref:Uncharacterized protein n=1 Tax=Fusarium equiseti TaxID=61235 RepID=A0A8J2NC12_FUSEQ|nr:unnamed protein product [Fusarium equiseti]
MSGNIKDQERVDALAEKLNVLLVIAIQNESPKPPEQRLDVLDSRFDQDEFHGYLKELHTHIVAKLLAPPIGDIPNLRPDITLQEHQMYAVSKAELAMSSQLKGEIEMFFSDDSMPPFRLARDRANVDDNFRYKIIVTSYHQVSAELGRLCQSFKVIWAYHKGRLPYEDLPKRPTVTLFSGVFNLRG